MKKYTILILAMALVLIGCSSKELKEKPIIEVKKEQLTIDYLENNINGILLNNIDKARDVEDGEYDLNTYEKFSIETNDDDVFLGVIGMYEITYILTDTDENTTEKTIDVTITSDDPEVSNPDTLVAKLNNEEITNSELYSKLKKQNGLNTLLRVIDLEILSDYEVDVEQDIVDKISDDIENQGLDEFKKGIEFIGIELDEGITKDEILNNKDVFDFYKLSFLRDHAAYLYALDKIEDDDALLESTYEAIEPDVCAIPLRFDTEDAAAAVLSDLNSADDIEAAYQAKYDTLGYDLATSDNDNCTAPVFSSNDQSIGQELHAHIFNLEDSEYTTVVKEFDNYFYLVYKVKQVDKPSFENMKQDLIDQLVEATTAQKGYAQSAMMTIRLDYNIIIFDQLIKEQFLAVNKEYMMKDTDSETLVATFDHDLDSDTAPYEISVDELYGELKSRYGTTTTLPKINLAALETVEAIQLDDEQIEEIAKQIQSMKQQYNTQAQQLAQQYGIFSWKDYIGYYGVTSEKELFNVLKTNTLTREYVFHINPVTQAEIDEALANWFEVNASHILFKCNDDSSCETALDKANVVIDTLNQTAETDLFDTFAELAKDVSEGPSAPKGGELGFFSPGNMVKEFEDAVRALEVGEYTTEAVKTQFGYHIIIVTEEKPLPTRPSDYDELTEDEKLQTEYGALINQLKESIKQNHLSQPKINKLLAELRDELGFNFLDAELQSQYELLQELYKENESAE
ncbi:peptidylprolyl isomerase [Haloplasma contractile]|uniref:peptidylprolyl isomerase n=1 Tax=Haloplasma contractile SSD-17B TaxID=1033810 RepID=U2E8I8_9MOLU|nr:peptidylprolyl isomerase [Haloplasma contractile]ERJ11211.1 peptidyl-prolyl cis-trans isomerase NIMA-interacting 1 protein [Haloplasma contractile SSD-17B]